MKDQRVKHLPAAIEGVRTHFENWRAVKSKRDRIPERLWKMATKAARQHGVHTVSRAVGLEYSALKRRVGPALSDPSTEVTRFVELQGMPAADRAGCVVELEKSNGTRMLISVRDRATMDWSWMKDAFLEA
ncbi:MAG: hypothetical protein KAI66_15545 [Lentisphaeria bacterium]|nr:hypothetical protein [Lentisphaeria bacterium]